MEFAIDVHRTIKGTCLVGFMKLKGAEYALLQRKYQFEYILQTVASHRDRAREKERYMRASYRNSLQQQLANIMNGLERLPAPTR